MISQFTKRLLGGAAAGLALVSLSGCHLDMWVQPKLKPQRQSEFFPDGMATHLPPAHTIAQGKLRNDPLFFEGAKDGKLATSMPFPVTREVVERGRERFNIICSHCHGPLGYGDGLIVQRGLALRRRPASYHTDRLRSMPIGHFFDVMTNGYGVMVSHADRLTPRDRWCVAAYIRTLQLSQHAKVTDIPAADAAKLAAEPASGGTQP